MDSHLPTFLIIGAAKSGTTTVYDYLARHPEVHMSREKEPCFFAFENETLNFQDPNNPLRNKVVTRLDQYLSLFDGASDKKAAGEASVVYMYSAKAVERIKHYVPGVRLIAILRHPVERAYSNYMMMRRDGREPVDDFLRAFEMEDERTRSNWEFGFFYKSLGFYHQQLARYYNAFDAAQIKVYLYEDLERDALKLIQSLYQFIGVDDTFIPGAEVRKNMSGLPRNKALFNLMSRPNPLRSLLRRILPRSVRAPLSIELKRKNLQKPSLSPDVHRKVLEIYRDDIAGLQKLIGRDLSGWLKDEGTA
jgi:hypothetical protein